MSADDPIDSKQDRRQWLKTSATVLGASLIPLPPETAEIAQADARQGKTTQLGEAKVAGRFFAPAQNTMVEQHS